jgi:transcriptional regulator with XRE-family HTH domain
MKDVAASTGLSASFISMVETGQTEISVGRLVSLATFYEVRLADLFPPGNGAIVLRRSERSTSETPDRRVKTEAFSSSDLGDKGGRLLSFEIDADLTESSSRAGRAFVLILSGRLRIDFSDDTSVSLETGDATWFEASRWHRYTNTSDARTEVLTLESPG